MRPTPRTAIVQELNEQVVAPYLAAHPSARQHPAGAQPPVFTGPDVQESGKAAGKGRAPQPAHSARTQRTDSARGRDDRDLSVRHRGDKSKIS